MGLVVGLLSRRNKRGITRIPQQPNAPAVILYREDITDDTKNFHTAGS
jgi:hypothetical protein